MAEKPEWARRAEKGGLLLENARRERQIERAREALEWRSEPSNEWRRRLLTPDERIRKALAILSEDASDVTEMQDSEGSVA